MRNNWKKRLLALGMGVLILAGGLTVAATQGTADDPLVTLSYLTDIFTPSVLKETQSKVDEAQRTYQANLDTKISEYTQELEGLSGAGVSDSAAMLYQLVELEAGQTLTGSAGCEIVLRTGTATCVSSGSPGLVDGTTGLTLEAGGTLSADHLYLVSVQPRGVLAVEDVTLLVRGSYSLSE